MAIIEQGTVFASHRIGRLLGVGRFAEVYEALAPVGALCAMKLLKKEAVSALNVEARILQEGEAAATIDHVNVVRFFDAGREQGQVFLLLELVRGKDLGRRIVEAGGALPVERAVRILRQACSGVAAAHDQAILHRDITLGNILVTDDGDLAKVTDFGSAKLAGFGVETAPDKQEDVSSILNMAPEYLSSRVAVPESDVYALACVLYQALTGVHPIASSPMTGAAIVARHAAYVPPPLVTLNRDLPGDLSHLMEGWLSKDPEARGTVGRMEHDLGEVLHRLNAPRRAIARNLEVPSRDHRLARTEQPMPAFEEAGRARPSVEAGRNAVLPPAIQGARVSVAPTQRSAIAPGRLLLAVTAPMATMEMPPERGSTGVPVERPAPPAGGRRGGIAAAIAAMGVVAVGAWATVAWMLVGGGGGGDVAGGVAPSTAPPSASAAAAAPASPATTAPVAATAMASASAAPPKPIAAPPRRRGAPARTKLPFP